MEKKFVKHYILATYSDNDGRVIRKMDMSEVVSNYELITDRIRRALLANDISDPDKLITYSFRMLGEYHDGNFHRKELVEINLDVLRETMNDFHWEDWGWVVAFQPLVDVAGYTIVEIDSEYPSYDPAPVAPEDYIQPCYRIYEGGAPDWEGYERYQREQRRRHDDTVDAEYVQEPPKETPKSQPEDMPWYTQVASAVKENIPTVLAVATSVAAITVMLRTAQQAADIAASAAERSEEILRHIEESIDDAIDMPQIVKVELGEDVELIGTGRRTW